MSPRHAALKRFLEDQQATLLWLFIEQSNLLHAQQLAVDLHEWEAVCEIAYGLDEAFHLLELHSERVRLNQSARVAASRIGDAEANARASLGQANALRHLGRATEALEVLELARALYGELGDKINQVRTITQMGHVLRESGDLESARDRYSSAMDLLAGQPDLGALSEILSNMANVQKLRGHLDEAEKLSRKAIALLQEIDAPSLRLLQELGWALGGLGAVHNRQGRLKESLEAHEASRRAFALLGNHVGQGYALLNLGRIAFDIGYQSYSQALLNTSLEAFSMAGDAHGRAKSLIALAKVSWRRGAAIDATRYFLLGVKQRHQILSDARQARKYASSDRRALSAGE
jgi:tetratricopeptide (TPR) repeat protein